MHGLRYMYHRFTNRFGCTRWYNKVTRLKWKLGSVHLEKVLILTKDRCTVSSNILLAQKSFWTHPMELVGDVGLVEPQLFPYRDSVSVGAR